MMTVYLDNCCFNRPYDDQSQTRVRLEAEAKMAVQDAIRAGQVSLVWSYILDYEIGRNPFADRRNEIIRWKNLADIQVRSSDSIARTAERLNLLGLKPIDALHIACAIEAKSGYFLTVDKGILRMAGQTGDLRIVTPIQFLDVLEEKAP